MRDVKLHALNPDARDEAPWAVETALYSMFAGDPGSYNLLKKLMSLRWMKDFRI